MINMVVGFDQREAVAYHAFCQSVISRTSRPVRFTPLVAHGVDGKRNGSNAFIYSRFLVPYLNEYKGWAIYADGDMICREDIAKLWAMRDMMAQIRDCGDGIRDGTYTMTAAKITGGTITGGNKLE